MSDTVMMFLPRTVITLTIMSGYAIYTVSQKTRILNELCFNVCRFCVTNIMSLGRPMCFKKLHLIKFGAFAWYSVKIRVIFGVRCKRLTKKQTYMKTETCKLCSIVFWIFLPNVIKSILIISNYTVSKLVRFLRHSLIIKKFNRYSKEKKQQYHAWFYCTLPSVFEHQNRIHKIKYVNIVKNAMNCSFWAKEVCTNFRGGSQCIGGDEPEWSRWNW